MTPTSHPTINHRLSEIAQAEILRENYQEALQYLYRADIDNMLIWKDGHVLHILIHQTECFIGLGDLNNIRKSARQFLRYMQEYPLVFQLEKLQAFISMMWQSNQLNVKLVISINATMFNHPEAYSNLKSLILSEMSDLKTELGDETYNAAWERGKALELETVVQDLLAEFGTEGG